MAFNVFLSIPSIPGESTDVSFAGTIVTPSYAWALENQVPLASSTSAGKATFAPLTIQKSFDKASPLLMQALVQGTPIAAMTLLLDNAAVQAQAEPFLVYQFSTVQIASISDSGSAGGDAYPFESVSFVFGAYQVRYRAPLPNGALSPTVLTSAWSVLTNSVPKGPGPGPG